MAIELTAGSTSPANAPGSAAVQRNRTARQESGPRHGGYYLPAMTSPARVVSSTARLEGSPRQGAALGIDRAPSAKALGGNPPAATPHRNAIAAARLAGVGRDAEKRAPRLEKVEKRAELLR
jgi:hypothetical protein